MPRPSRRETQPVPERSAETRAMPATAARSRRVTSEANQPRERRGLARRLRIDLKQDGVGAVARLVGAAGRQMYAALAEIDGLRREVQYDGCRLRVDACNGDAAGLRHGDHRTRARDD